MIERGRKTLKNLRNAAVRPMVLLWALGVPIPIILIIFLLRGCH